MTFILNRQKFWSSERGSPTTPIIALFMLCMCSNFRSQFIGVNQLYEKGKWADEPDGRETIYEILLPMKVSKRSALNFTNAVKYFRTATLIRPNAKS